MKISCLIVLTLVWLSADALAEEQRPRARDIGLIVGNFPTGKLNSITDVQGVRVGHHTIIKGDDIRTGVTAIIPTDGNMFVRPIPAAIHVGNGYGKLLGVTQVQELGQLESPILLTCTICVWRAADALKEWMYQNWEIGDQTVNPVVGETNDFRLSNGKANPVGQAEVNSALEQASADKVIEGSVGAGTGTQAFGWKGGIGTSSRVLPDTLGGYKVGVLVQTNFGGTLKMNGAPVGETLGRFAFQKDLSGKNMDDGSIMMVVATDAPILSRNLERLAMRAMMGLARTGSYASNGSGDYVIAFSTHEGVRLPRSSNSAIQLPTLTNGAMSPLFAATVEATEEAIYNAMLKATTVESSRGELEALPIPEVIKILANHKMLKE